MRYNKWKISGVKVKIRVTRTNGKNKCKRQLNSLNLFDSAFRVVIWFYFFFFLLFLYSWTFLSVWFHCMHYTNLTTKQKENKKRQKMKRRWIFVSFSKRQQVQINDICCHQMGQTATITLQIRKHYEHIWICFCCCLFVLLYFFPGVKTTDELHIKYNNNICEQICTICAMCAHCLTRQRIPIAWFSHYPG